MTCLPAVPARLAAALFALGLASAASGCTRPATQLLVVVETDADQSAYECVRIEVLRYPRETAPRGSSTGLLVPAQVTLPFSAGIVPPDGDARARVEVVAELRRDSCADRTPGEAPPLVSRAVRTGFLPDQTLRLPVFLADRCRDVLCAAEETCEGTTGTCVPIPDVDPGDLEVVRPGDELVDAGATSDARVPRDTGPASDAALPTGGFPAPQTTAEVVTLGTGGRIGSFAIDDASGALVLAFNQISGDVLGLPAGPRTRARIVRYEGGTATPLATWDSNVSGGAAAQIALRARGGDVFVCAGAEYDLMGTPAVSPGALLFARLTVATGAVVWAHVLSLPGAALTCPDFELLSDGSMVASIASSPAPTSPQGFLWDGAAVPDSVFGGLAVIESAGAGGSVLTMRVADRGDRAEIAHARFYAQAGRLLVEATPGGYVVSAYSGRSLGSEWGSDLPTMLFGGSSTDVGVARYALDPADPTGERFSVGGSPFSVAYSSGQGSANVVSLGARLFFVSSASRNPTYSSWGIWGCVRDADLPGLGREPVTYLLELDPTMSVCITPAPTQLGQATTRLSTRGWGTDDMFVYGGISASGTTQPVELFGAPLTFGESERAFIADFSPDLATRWRVDVTGAPGAILGVRPSNDARVLWVHGSITGTGMLLGTPVSGEFLARLTSP